MTRFLIPSLLGVLLLGWLLTGVTQIQPGERAVVRRFGRVLDDQPGPGLHLGLPWGIDRVDRVPVNLVRKVKFGYEPDAEDSPFVTPPGQLLTGDYNLINVQVVIEYTVASGEVVDYLLNEERSPGLISRAGEAALAEWVAGQSIDVVLLQGKHLLPLWLLERTQNLL